MAHLRRAHRPYRPYRHHPSPQSRTSEVALVHRLLLFVEVVVGYSRRILPNTDDAGVNMHESMAHRTKNQVRTSIWGWLSIPLLISAAIWCTAITTATVTGLRRTAVAGLVARLATVRLGRRALLISAPWSTQCIPGMQDGYSLRGIWLLESARRGRSGRGCGYRIWVYPGRDRGRLAGVNVEPGRSVNILCLDCLSMEGNGPGLVAADTQEILASASNMANGDYILRVVLLGPSRWERASIRVRHGIDESWRERWRSIRKCFINNGWRCSVTVAQPVAKHVQQRMCQEQLWIMRTRTK